MFEDDGVSSVMWERADVPKVQAAYPLIRKEPSVEWRDVNGWSFVIVGHPLTMWPPPISLGPGDVESTFWSFKIKDNLLVNVALAVLATALNEDHIGYFCAAVCNQLERVSVKTDLLLRSRRRGPLSRTSGTWCSSERVDSRSGTQRG
jgi:hypothetical protein